MNAACLALAAWLVPGFTISGFWAALFGALVISVISWLLSTLLIDKRTLTAGAEKTTAARGAPSERASGPRS